MTDHNDDMLPDWLRDSYKQQGARPAPGTGPLRRPTTGNLSPEPPQPKPVTGRLGLDSPARQDNSERLTIKNYLIEGDPDPILEQHLSPQKMMSDNILLKVMYDVIEQMEKQIVMYIRQDDTQELPDHVENYKVPEIASRIGEYPVQLATVLTDIILMASGEIETCPKQMRQQAILGVSQQIINMRRKVAGNQAASIRVTGEILTEISERAVPPADLHESIKIHTRKLFLRSVIEEYQKSQREDKLPGSSWLG